MGGMKMEKLYRFIAKYAWTAYWLWVICLVILWGVAVWLGVPQVLAGVLLVGLTWIGARWIFTRDQALRRKPWAALAEQCDPYPILEELKVQQSYQGTKSMKLTRIMDYATALSEIGEEEQAYALKASIKDDVARIDSLSGHAIYSHNMSVACMKLGKWQEMEYWHQKMMEAIQRMPLDRQRHAHHKQMQGYYVRYHYSRQEYIKSLEILDSMKPGDLRQEVANAMNYARNYRAMGNTEKAKEALTFVVENGNKLYVVQQARQMLTQLDNFEGE